MLKIDAHQHCWQFDPVRDSWITGEMSVIRRDFMPADLLPVLQHNGLDGTVLVQTCHAEDDNRFMLKLADENDLFIRTTLVVLRLEACDLSRFDLNFHT